MGSFISFIPTPFEDVHTFFELAPVSSADVVYDLGSGDGRLLFAALEKGAGRAVGVELDPGLAGAARKRAKEMGLQDRVEFLTGDLTDTILSQATVVLCYLNDAASVALRPKLEEELKAGTRVVMESFPVHGWTAVDIKARGYRTFYSYRMPGPAPMRADDSYEPTESIIKATMARLKETLIDLAFDGMGTKTGTSASELSAKNNRVRAR